MIPLTSHWWLGGIQCEGLVFELEWMQWNPWLSMKWRICECMLLYWINVVSSDNGRESQLALEKIVTFLITRNKSPWIPRTVQLISNFKSHFSTNCLHFVRNEWQMRNKISDYISSQLTCCIWLLRTPVISMPGHFESEWKPHTGGVIQPDPLTGKCKPTTMYLRNMYTV